VFASEVRKQLKLHGETPRKLWWVTGSVCEHRPKGLIQDWVSGTTAPGMPADFGPLRRIEKRYRPKDHPECTLGAAAKFAMASANPGQWQVSRLRHLVKRVWLSSQILALETECYGALISLDACGTLRPVSLAGLAVKT